VKRTNTDVAIQL